MGSPGKTEEVKTGYDGTIILFEDEDNPYEKTFVGAKLKSGQLTVTVREVSYDGIYGTDYCFDMYFTEELTKALETEQGQLLNKIKERFGGSGVESELKEFCNEHLIEYKRYDS